MSKLTSKQRAVLDILLTVDPDMGILTGCLARKLEKPTFFCAPKLHALASHGFAFRHPTNRERWSSKPWPVTP